MKYGSCAALMFALAVTAPLQAQIRTAAATPAKPAATATPAQSGVQVPAPDAMIIMIRSSLVALSQANATNNYTVLNALGSPSFRNANSPQKLSETFAAFRSNNIDLSPVTLLQPSLVAPARIENGLLRMTGFFPSQPMRVMYDLSYEPIGGRWQLQGIAVNLVNSQQAVAPKQAPVVPSK
jgi:hypothetical protein